jgi:hypothetical protein
MRDIEKMKIQRKSVITGVVRELDIPADPNDVLAWEMGLGSIHDLIPYLNDADREFIISGITPDEWRAALLEAGI